MKQLLLFLLLLVSPVAQAQAQAQARTPHGTVSSPDGKLKVDVSLDSGRPLYSVTYDGRVILEPSPLGLVTNEGDFSSAMKWTGSSQGIVDKTYTQTRIKQSGIDYRANTLTCTFENATGRPVSVLFQVSDNDIAFRYELPEWGDTKSCVVTREATGFDFPSVATTFLSPMMAPMAGFARTSPSYESGYEADAAMGKGSDEGYVFPGLFRIGDRGWVLVSETGVSSLYCASHLSGGTSEGLYTVDFPNPAQNNGFGGSGAQLGLPGVTPWRTITVGPTLAPIVETTIPWDVVDPLYEPSRPYEGGRSTWSWVVWQDQSMNWDDQVKFIDLAAEMGYEYILMDCFWDVEIGRERMPELIRYAASKGVGVMLWYNSNGTVNDAPQSPKNRMNTSVARKAEMRWLREVGVKGLKVDFLGGDKQETMRLYEDILSDANDHGLSIIFHGATLPRGWERMYPNFMGSEAVVASEMLYFSPQVRRDEAFYATLHPFIRNSVASMEFGGVFLNKYLVESNTGPRNERLTTDAFQLATAVLFQNPIQMFALTPNNLTDAPAYAIDFMRRVPTTWDETRYIDGYPGKYAVIARRHGTTWYVAGVNAGTESLTLDLDLPMLSGGELSIIDDDERRPSPRSATKKKNGKISVTMQPRGGFVLTERIPASTVFTNPMLWADVPDPDVTRKGDTFYLMSTTMHLMPGGPVMASKDLVHWETVSYVFDTLHETPKYEMEGGTVYGRGQWATSIQYHDGMFWVLFSPNDEPWRSFIYKTDDPAKGWTLHSRMRHFHDADLFFDDDGRVYVFYGTGELCELEPDLSGVKEGGIDQKIFERDAEETGLLEGSRVVKHNGKYYLIMISAPRELPRRQLAYRADRITGPYEKKIILEDNFAGFPYAAQGGIVDDEAGNWYGIIFQDRGAVGRVPLMIPVRWVDGWPLLSDKNGKVPLTGTVPFEPHDTGRRIVESDDFGTEEMKIVWQWNHNPIDGAWSLTDRPGWLRLKTNHLSENIFTARNTLTQRMEGPRSTGIAAFDLSHMHDGDVAGLSAFNGDSGVLSVRCEGGKKTLVMTVENCELDDRTKAVTAVRIEEQGRVELTGDEILLRVDGDFNLRQDMATFRYSLDRGATWTPIGTPFKMRFDYRRHFMGSKFAIFNYATKSAGGWVDVDYFDYTRHAD